MQIIHPPSQPRNSRRPAQPRSAPLRPAAPRYPGKNLDIFGDPRNPRVFPVFPKIPQISHMIPRFTPNFPYDREINNIQKYSTWRSFLAFLVTLDFTNHYTIHAGMHLKVFAAQNGMPQVASDYYGLNCTEPICPRLTIANLRRCRLPHVAPDYYGLT